MKFRQNLLAECHGLIYAAFKECDKIGNLSASTSNLDSFSIQSGQGRAGVDLCKLSPGCEISKNKTKIKMYIKMLQVQIQAFKC